MEKLFVIVPVGEPVDAESATGILGRIGVDNVYLTAYPAIWDGFKQPSELDVDERTRATYNLSGSKGTYDIVRVS